MMRFVLLCLFFSHASGLAAEENTNAAANPVRKVVTMLQMMMNKIEAEAKKEKELYDKFMCYCKTADEELSKSIEEANTKIPQLESDIKEQTEEKAATEAALAQHQTDRDAAKTAMAKATAMREKENTAYVKESSTDMSNLDALKKALAAITKGMAGGFLETNEAAILRKLTVSKADMLDVDRQALVSFLSGTQQNGYAPASAEIVGILKQMQDVMEQDIEEENAAEASAAQTYEELMAAKKKEVDALQASIETAMTRIGELGISIATMKNDLEDTKEGLAEDTVYLGDLDKTCATKTKEWEARCEEVSQEKLALTETIKILNDDDALELFKKTLPSASFLQLQVTNDHLRKQALSLLQARTKNSVLKAQPIDFVELALQGKKAGFEKVIKLIDEMVVTLKKEQVEDDHKKEYCEFEIDKTEDTKKVLEQDIADSEKAITETTGAIQTVTEEIQELEASIADLDKSVATATAQRKEEHADFTVVMANNAAAKELILFAKNRMQKFYNPKLYKPPPKRELTEEERITLNMGGTLAPTNPPGGIAGTGVSFVQVRAHQKTKDDAPPAPPPEAKFGGKKSEESGGVLAMMDLLVAEIDKEITTAKLEEKDAQDDYEKLTTESSNKRSSDSKAMTDKNSAKAEMETELQATKDAKEATTTELKATMDYLHSLHKECDWLLENYSQRKEARASEIDAMGKAKAVLNGADYSLLQIKPSSHFLRLK